MASPATRRINKHCTQPDPDLTTFQFRYDAGFRLITSMRRGTVHQNGVGRRSQVASVRYARTDATSFSSASAKEPETFPSSTIPLQNCLLANMSWSQICLLPPSNFTRRYRDYAVSHHVWNENAAPESSLMQRTFTKSAR